MDKSMYCIIFILLLFIESVFDSQVIVRETFQFVMTCLT